MLLEQVVSSTIERCVEPTLMEQSVRHTINRMLPIVRSLSYTQVVEVICERS